MTDRPSVPGPRPVRPVPGPHLHRVMGRVLADPPVVVAAPPPPPSTAAEAGRLWTLPDSPAHHPLDLPSVGECLVRIEAVRARRRGPQAWRTPERELRAAQLLHAMLRGAYAGDVHLVDFDAAGDLPGLAYDTVVLLERVEAAR